MDPSGKSGHCIRSGPVCCSVLACLVLLQPARAPFHHKSKHPGHPEKGRQNAAFLREPLLHLNPTSLDPHCANCNFSGTEKVGTTKKARDKDLPNFLVKTFWCELPPNPFLTGLCPRIFQKNLWCCWYDLLASKWRRRYPPPLSRSRV